MSELKKKSSFHAQMIVLLTRKKLSVTVQDPSGPQIL